MKRWINYRQGIWPIAKKVMLQEVQGWVNEMVNTMAIPCTFFLAFGLGLRDYIADVQGVPYMAFLTPGLVTMTILLEAYRTGAWGLWLDRWHQKMLDEYRIKPIHTTDIIMGEILGGFLVAMVKGFVVGAILLLFSPVDIQWAYMPWYLATVLPGCIFFTCLGCMAGTFFPKPDHIAQSQTIFVTPLLYLGGLFFPISTLPDWVCPLVNWLPTTGAFEGGRQILLHGEVNLMYLAVMWGAALLSFMGATWLFKEKLSE
ncbi:MAG TPA: ABC transporter permease [Oculatellaceae cyanobacterium]|jgi:lipooligosaccharide transport system permease protein